MKRRAFLAAIAVAAADPERLLWVPGRKLISIPAPRIVGVELAIVAERVIAGVELVEVEWVGRNQIFFIPKGARLNARFVGARARGFTSWENRRVVRHGTLTLITIPTNDSRR